MENKLNVTLWQLHDAFMLSITLVFFTFLQQVQNIYGGRDSFLSTTALLFPRVFFARSHNVFQNTNLLFSCSLMQHNPQLEDPFSPSSQSQRGTAAKQERVETKGDDVSHMLKGYLIHG